MCVSNECYAEILPQSSTFLNLFYISSKASTCTPVQEKKESMLGQIIYKCLWNDTKHKMKEDKKEMTGQIYVYMFRTVLLELNILSLEKNFSLTQKLLIAFNYSSRSETFWDVPNPWWYVSLCCHLTHFV